MEEFCLRTAQWEPPDAETVSVDMHPPLSPYSNSPPLPRTRSGSVPSPMDVDAGPASLHPAVAPTWTPFKKAASPSKPSNTPKDNSTSSTSKLPPLRISTKGWDIAEMCRTYSSFQEVPRLSALKGTDVLLEALDEYEKDGIPLIIDNWQHHPKWPADVFSIDWLLRTAGEEEIHVRNVHDRKDHSMVLSEFVKSSRSQSYYAAPGELQRLYWKDADCPPAWRDWLLTSGAIPSRVLPCSPDDYLGYLTHSESVESLLCYMGIGDTYTAAHKDLCASSGHNLMCFAEDGGSSYWFMTAADDAPKVAEYFHTQLRQELDWETHFTTIDELGRAPFTVYVAQQKVGDLVMVPPRSCHQVVNHGGLAMKTSWSRMTLNNLITALRYELPIYRRVCRPEQYRTKTILYRSMLRLTEQLSLAVPETNLPDLQQIGDRAVSLGPEDDIFRLNNPEAFLDYPDSPTSPGSPTITVQPLDRTMCALKLKKLVELFDQVLHEEYAVCHADFDHVIRPDTGNSATGWGITTGPLLTDDNDAVVPSSPSKFRLVLQPPADSLNRRDGDRARERAAACNLACDFCGADIFQSFFECKVCRRPGDDPAAQVGDGLLVCPACYVEGRMCNCEDMHPAQCRPFDILLADRNEAAAAVSTVLDDSKRMSKVTKGEVLTLGDLCVFEAACALHKFRHDNANKLHLHRRCRLNAHYHGDIFSEGLNCKTCHAWRCFYHLLDIGTHSAEAILEFVKDPGSIHRLHKVNWEALRTAGGNKKLFKLDSVPSAKDRLRIAALSFPKCRPGHPKVKLGFYDKESKAIDLVVEPVELVLQSLQTRERPASGQRSGSSSPLTPCGSDNESSSDEPKRPPCVLEETIAVPPRVLLSADSTIDSDEKDAVIEIDYSEGSTPDADTKPVQPPSLSPRPSSSMSSAFNIPTNTAYVSIPMPPSYISDRKRVDPSPRTSSLVRSKQHKVVTENRVDARDVDGNTSSSRTRSLSKTKTSRPSVDEDDYNVADNSGALQLMKAMQSALASDPTQVTVKKPKRPQIVLSSDDGDASADDDNGEKGSPRHLPNVGVRISRRTSVPTSKNVTRFSASTSANGPSLVKSGSRAHLPHAGPSLPRPLVQKRVREEISPERDGPAARLHPTTAGVKEVTSSTGPPVKKRKGPPGIPADEMAKRKEAQEKEKERHKVTDVYHRNGKTLARGPAGDPPATEKPKSRPVRKPEQGAPSASNAHPQPARITDILSIGPTSKTPRQRPSVSASTPPGTASLRKQPSTATTVATKLPPAIATKAASPAVSASDAAPPQDLALVRQDRVVNDNSPADGPLNQIAAKALRQIEAGIGTLGQTVPRLLAEFAEYRELVKKVEANTHQLSVLRQTVDTLRDENRKRIEERDLWKKGAEASKRETEALKREVEASKGRVGALKEEVENLKEESRAKDARIKELVEAQQKTTQTLADNTARLAFLEREGNVPKCVEDRQIDAPLHFTITNAVHSVLDQVRSQVQHTQQSLEQSHQQGAQQSSQQSSQQLPVSEIPMPHRQDNRQRLYGNDSRHPEHPPQRLGQSHSRGQAYGDRSYRHYQYNHHNWQGPGLEKQADLRSLPDGHRARGPGSHTGQRTDSARHSQSSRRHGERRSRSRSPRRERSHSSRQRSTPDESIVSDYSPQDKHRADTSMSPTDTFDALSERHKARPYSSIWGSSYAEDERRSSRSDMDRRSTRPGDDRHATYTDERHRESHRSPSRSRSRSRHRSSHRSRESSKRRDPTPSSNRWRQ